MLVSLALESLLCIIEPVQRVVPFFFERRGNKTVVWVDLHEAPPCNVSFVASALDLLLTQSLCLFYPGLDLAFDLESNLDGLRCEGIHQQL